VATSAATISGTTSRHRYIPRGLNQLHTIFRRHFDEFCDLYNDGEEVTVNAGKRAWARLLAKVYEIDPLVCPRCGWEMKIIAVIQDPVDIRDIRAHLVKTGRAPPGFDPALLNWQTLELHLMRRLGQVCTRHGGEMLEPHDSGTKHGSASKSRVRHLRAAALNPLLPG